MAKFACVWFAAAVSGTSASLSVSSALRQNAAGRSVAAVAKSSPLAAEGDATPNFVLQATKFSRRLRVCNAYPSSDALDVYLDGHDKLTEQEPLQYRSCQEFTPDMKAGDKLDFKVGDDSTGTFEVSELPESDSVLLLVIHRHDTMGTAPAFESHVFANLANPQIAVIDTYKGAARARTRILDAAGSFAAAGGGQNRSEEMRFGSVVAVNPGIYQVELDNDEGKVKAKSDLVAAQHESYVVLRTGVEATAGTAYAQDLVVFPKSMLSALQSGSARSTWAMAAALSAMIAAIFSQ